MSETTFYLEFLSLGGQVKVMAIDPNTGIEVSIIAPETASQEEMTSVAVEKLKRRLEKETQPAGVDPSENQRPSRGILV